MDSGAKMEQFMLKRMRQVEEQVTDGAIQIEGKSQKLQAVLPVAEELAIEVKDETIDVEMINTRFSLEHPREDNLNDWVLDNFKKKTCAYFIATADGERCGCGYFQSDHKRLPTMKDESWDSQRHTEESPTNAFGTIAFATQSENMELTGYIHEAEYIRLSDTTSVERISILLREVWGLKLPKILVSITGGNKEDSIPGDILKILGNGLAKVLRSADTWIISGGTHSGVNKTVGKIFQTEYHRDRKFRNACIGIVPWGCTKGRKQLYSHGGESSYRISTQFSGDDGSVEIKEANLSENHTHFLLVDDGSQHVFGIEKKLKARLEKFLADKIILDAV